MATVALFGKRIPDEARAFVEQALLTLKEEGAKILMHDRLQKQLNEQHQFYCRPALRKLLLGSSACTRQLDRPF